MRASTNSRTSNLLEFLSNNIPTTFSGVYKTPLANRTQNFIINGQKSEESSTKSCELLQNGSQAHSEESMLSMMSEKAIEKFLPEQDENQEEVVKGPVAQETVPTTSTRLELPGGGSQSYHPSQSSSGSSSFIKKEEEANKFICNANKVWTCEFDKLLVDWSAKYYNDWKKIAKKFYKEQGVRVTTHFLRLKFKDLQGAKGVHDATTVLNADWDMRIVELTLKFGLKWNVVAEELNFSDPIKLKNRFYNHIKKKNRYEQIIEKLNQENELAS